MSKATTTKTFYLFLLIFFLVWGFRATIFYSIDNSISSDFGLMIYSQTLKFALWALPVFFFIKIIEKNSLKKSLKLSLSKDKILPMFIWVLLYALVMVLVAALQYSKAPHLPEVGLLTLLSRNIISPFSEEVMFRGFILNRFMSITEFWKANLLTSLLFAGIHMPYWLLTRGFNLEIIADLIGVVVFSLIVGYFFKKFNSLVPSIFAHIANNLVTNLF